MWKEIRKTLLAGLLVLAPIALTVYILYSLFRFMDNLLRDAVIQFLVTQFGMSQPKAEVIPGLGILAILLLLLITGTIARHYAGRKLFALGDYIVTRIPLANRIYIAIREISEAFLSEKAEVFKKAVLIEFPSKGLYSVAFFTQDTKGIIQEKLKQDMVSLFLPTTPNPTTGYLLFVPKSKVIELDMPVEDALKLVISGGSIHLKEKWDAAPVSLFRKGEKRKHFIRRKKT